MASTRKYAALPDLDSAPDIYETPELTDDLSTIRTSTARSSSASASSSYKDLTEDEDGDGGVSHHHLRPEQARAHFSPAVVDARHVDFSDRIGRTGGKRRSYRTGTARRRRGDDDDAVRLGDLSDEADGGDGDAEEGLRRKIARLRREVQEVTEAVAGGGGRRRRRERRRRPGGGGGGGGGGGDQPDEAEEVDEVDEGEGEGGMAALGKVLDDLLMEEEEEEEEEEEADEVEMELNGGEDSNEDVHGGRGAADDHDHDHDHNREPSHEGRPPPSSRRPPAPTTTTTTTTTITTTALARAASFDARLSQLERALGLAPTPPTLSSSTSTSTSTSTSPSSRLAQHPILPTLAQLQRQMHTLAHLTSTQDLNNPDSSPLRLALPQLRLLLQQQPQQPQPQPPQPVPHDDATITALYATLPTIERYAPLLAPLLDRLRALGPIQAQAAQAAHVLAEAERAQAALRAETDRWRAGLERVEHAVAQAVAAARENRRVLGGWVRALEARVRALRAGG
ncbi:MAG: hypothetical protein M1826_004949 [Phylliscum demangeonii]|nr:MAG: hypothetical protein M1826_004949 [Phylliscum demangeonii]